MASRKPPRPTTVVLVRHGQTPTTGSVLPGRAPGLHLSETGREQAEGVARFLRDRIKPVAVYSSPMERARETAAPIARTFGLRVRTRAGLNECDFGDWTGRKLADLRRRREWRTVQRFPSGFRFPGGESFAEMQARMVGQVAELVGQHPGATIVATSHADTIKAAVASAVGTHLDLFQRIIIGPCSMTTITFSAEGPIVMGVNQVAS